MERLGNKEITIFTLWLWTELTPHLLITDNTFTLLSDCGSFGKSTTTISQPEYTEIWKRIPNEENGVPKSNEGVKKKEWRYSRLRLKKDVQKLSLSDSLLG